MTETKFQPGTLVRDNRGKVGKVAGSPGSVTVDGVDEQQFTVDFWGEKERRLERWLTPLDDDCPEALLLNRPADLATWADETPLKLVALALAVDGGRGQVSDIRAKLEGRVIHEGQWKNWWSKRSKALGGLPEHFEVAKATKGNDYKLLSVIDDVPADWTPPSKPKTVKLADWKKWLNSKSHEQPPGRFPTKPVADALVKWPASDIEHSLNRVISAAQEFSEHEEPSSQAAEGWLRAVAQASLRWREVADPDSRGREAARVGELLARLSRIAGERTPLELLFRAGALDGQPEAWREGFLAGLWYTFGDEDAHQIYMQSLETLGRQARDSLARELFIAAFDPNFSEQRHRQLDRLLDALPESHRTRLLQEAVAYSAPDQRTGVLGYIANSRHTQSTDRLPLRMAAAMLLTDGTGAFAVQTSRELAGAIDAPGGGVPSVQALLLGIVERHASELEEVKQDYEQKLNNEKQKLEEAKKQISDLEQQVWDLDAELRANREESRLKIREGMILAIGEVLQSVHRNQNNIEKVVGDVEVGLASALKAGGAEPLETPGTSVSYKPQWHEAIDELQATTSVKVVAPGVIVRDGTIGDKVLLKAQVKREVS